MKKDKMYYKGTQTKILLTFLIIAFIVSIVYVINNSQELINYYFN